MTADSPLERKISDGVGMSDEKQSLKVQSLDNVAIVQTVIGNLAENTKLAGYTAAATMHKLGKPELGDAYLRREGLPAMAMNDVGKQQEVAAKQAPNSPSKSPDLGGGRTA
jgi:hypothetical protein